MIFDVLGQDFESEILLQDIKKAIEEEREGWELLCLFCGADTWFWIFQINLNLMLTYKKALEKSTEEAAQYIVTERIGRVEHIIFNRP